MWKEDLKREYARNRRLIQGSCLAGTTSMLLVVIGFRLAIPPVTLDRIELLTLGLLIALVTSISFGWWTYRSSPRYPRTWLEYQEEVIEREVVKEWGPAIHCLRETIVAGEECFESVFELHRECLNNGSEPSLKQTTLLAMHNKACNLSRSVADLCQRGHAEAAFILWRSIFEIEVNMQYIALDETDCRAERFADWGRAAYLRLNFPNSSELESLRGKYPNQDMDREIGWTRPKNPIGVPGRARVIGYLSKQREGRATTILNMYEESNSYSHYDAMAIVNDLGNNRPLNNGPSASGHDMPLCLTARSIAVINRTLIDSQSESNGLNMEPLDRVVYARHAQVPLEVAMVPERLLSRSSVP